MAKEIEVKTLKHSVVHDSHVIRLCATYDMQCPDEIETTIAIPNVPNQWSIGAVIGPSGTGKTIIGTTIGTPIEDLIGRWDDNQSVVSQLGDDAVNICAAVGMHSIPSLLRPFGKLSLGEQNRCQMAKLVHRAKAGQLLTDRPIFVDEFCSHLDATTALSIATKLGHALRLTEYRFVFASQRLDILTPLSPDWLWNTRHADMMQSVDPPRKPEIIITEITGGPSKRAAWNRFRSHHYMSGELNISARCFIAKTSESGEWVGFCAAISQPGRVANMWRSHRLVILPEFQGLGYGPQLEEHVGELILAYGKRFMSKTIHPRLGKYREASRSWKPTSKNRVLVNGNWNKGSYKTRLPLTRVSWSHEFTGIQVTQSDPLTDPVSFL